MKNNLKVFSALLVLSFLWVASASSVSVWQGQYYDGTTFNTGTYTFNFTIYDDLTGGTICFTNTTSLTTGSWGEWRTEQSPWASCNNASKDYFLNINIAGTDEAPRRRLTVSDFLRRDVAEVQQGNLIVSNNVSADYYIGDGSYLTGIAGSGDINSVQGDGVYLYNGSDSGNVILAFNESRLNSSIDARGGSLNVNSSVYSNATSWWASVSSWVSGWFYNDGGVLSFNESKFNSTIDERTFGLGDNSSWNESYADGKYSLISEPLWSGNFSLYNSSWSLDTDTNETTRLNALVETDCGAGNLVIGIQANGTVLCAADSEETYSHLSNFTDDILWTSEFNATGDTRWGGSVDTQKNASGYLHNDSTTIYLNESLLNSTIDDREYDTLGDIGACGNEQVVKWNTTSSVWYCSDVAVAGAGDIDAVNTDGKYLTGGQTSGSVNLLLNESVLNETISSEGLRLGFNSTFNSTYDNWAYNQTIAAINNILSFGYYNSTDFSIGDYYLNSNPFDFYNSTTLPSSTETDPYWSANFSLYNSSWSSTYNSTYNAWAYNQTIAANAYTNEKISSVNTTANIKSLVDATYLNLSGTNANQDINVSPYNLGTANLTLAQKITFALGEIVDNAVDGWIRITGGLNVSGDLEVVGNMTVEGINLEGDSANHRIYDNSSCVIIKGDTSTMYIC